jgi:hypothetical protein
MGSPDRWLTINDDGSITLHEENDGWTFINRGAERHDTPVTLDYLKQYHPDLYRSACTRLVEYNRERWIQNPPLCECCQRKPKEISKIFDVSIYRLCNECGSSGKYADAKEAPWPPQQYTIRDGRREHPTGFYFVYHYLDKGTSPDVHLWLPMLPSPEYRHCKVVNTRTLETVNLGDDAVIDLYAPPIMKG